jgi:dimethylaniline monooxygenase (N-oxide forming)
MNPQVKLRVCVIGAGISGLAATKELRELGVDVECYEMMPIISGTFGSYTWNHGRLTSSTISTWFSDFPVEDRQHFMSWAEFVDYLGRYVDHFGFRDRIQLNCKAVAITQLDGGGWRIRFQRGNHSNGHPLHPGDVDVQDETFEREFTHLIAATGLNHLPRIPELPGLEGFAGQVLHSSEYRDAEQLRGRRVLVVGAGESGSDIAAQVSQVASACTISVRSSPGTLFPKWIQGDTPDIRDDRLTYNLPRRLAPIIRRGHRRFYSIQTETPELFAWAARSNWDNDRCSFNSMACKSFGIPEAIVHHGARLVPGISRIEAQRVSFANGDSVEVDVIIFATGFRIGFPLLGAELEEQLVCVNELWKNAVHPEIGEQLMILGFARPHQINQLTTVELQARMAALVISGRASLPSAAQMRATIAADQAFMREHYGARFEHNPGLVDQLYFTAGLAKFIGCEVPWRQTLARDPELAFKLIYAAISGAHHRLAGPGATPELAARTIKRTPLFSNRRNAAFRWGLLSVLTGIAYVGGKLDPGLRLITDQARP